MTLKFTIFKLLKGFFCDLQYVHKDAHVLYTQVQYHLTASAGGDGKGIPSSPGMMLLNVLLCQMWCTT